MRWPRRFAWPSLRPGLAVMLVAVLSVAILPLGLISVYQTKKVLDERRNLSGIALLEQTQRAASDGREIVSSAVSAVETLAAMVPAIRGSDETCNAVMEKMVADSSFYAFAGYVDVDGRLVCGSTVGSSDRDVQMPFYESDRRRRVIAVRSLEFLSGMATVSVSVPAYDDGRLLGTTWIAIPVTELNAALVTTRPELDLALFQNEGELVATEEFAEGRRAILPRDESLMDILEHGHDTFRGFNRRGELRDFAVVPIVEDRVFALGSWPPQDRGGLVMPAYQEVIALYFPFFMWATTIAVAYVGVHRLVIRHVRRLQSWMRRYADGTENFETASLKNAPEELEVVAEAFRTMTRRLSEQDRRREEDLREKTVLLREVHHRVKNNLQLISSMMNIQIRATKSPEAKRLLHRVQDRVMALSAIHRYLYMARNVSRPPADQLLAEIVHQLVVVGSVEEAGRQIKVSTDFEPVEITTDQSVPLSLLLTEAATNAVKHCSISGDGPPWIKIALTSMGDETLCLSVVNSLAEGDGGGDADRLDGSGLGSQLLRSFVTQLEGTLEIKEFPGRYELHVRFPSARPANDAPEA